MTIEELMTSDKEMLIPKDVAPILGCNPYSINVQAKADPSKLGFQVALIGTTVRIPRRAFIRWLTGESRSECVVARWNGDGAGPV